MVRFAEFQVSKNYEFKIYVNLALQSLTSNKTLDSLTNAFSMVDSKYICLGDVSVEDAKDMHAP